MKTARHQDGDSFDIAHADIKRSNASGKRSISFEITQGVNKSVVRESDLHEGFRC